MHPRINIFSLLLPLLVMVAIAERPSAIASDIEFSKETFDLPATVTEAVLAKRGRLAILRMADTKSLAVFDLLAGKIVKEIPRDESWKVAAGQNMLVLIESATGKLERWSLDPIKQVDTKKLQLSAPIGAVAMGCRSDGPLLVLPGAGHSEQWIDEIKLFDPRTLQPIHEHVEMGRGRLPPVDWPQVRIATASPIGNVFCIPAAQCVLRIEGTDVFAQFVDAKQKMLFPGNIGEYLYGAPTPIDQILRRLPTRRGNLTAEDYTRPDVDGPFYLQMRSGGIALAGTDAPLATPPASVPTQKKMSDGRITPLVSYLVSGANLMFSLVNDNRRLERITFDAERLTMGAAAGTLTVLTRPQQFVRAGTEFRYQVRSMTSGAKANYALENGPPGMQVSTSGLVIWKVPTTLRDNVASVMVRANGDPGLTKIHRFELEVVGATIDPNARLQSALLTPPIDDPTAIKPLQLLQPSQELPLASAVNGAVVAGGGRFLILRMHALSKLAVLDVTVGKVVGYLPLPSEQSLVAGGADCVVIVQRDQVQRWRLTDLSLDRSTTLTLRDYQMRSLRTITDQPPPSKVAPLRVLMGSATTGPITIAFPPAVQYASDASFVFLDGRTLEPLNLKLTDKVDRRTAQRPRISANGHLLTSMTQAMVFRGDSVGVVATGNARGELLPTADGRFLLGNGIALTDQVRLAGFKVNGVGIPAVHGPYFLLVDGPFRDQSIRGPRRITKEEVSLCVLGDHRPLARISTSHPVYRGSQYNSRAPLPYDERLWLIPDAKVLIELSPDRKRLTMQPLDIDQVLERCSYPYLFFDSSPELAIQAGKKWTYRPRIRCKHGPAKVRVPIAPKRMQMNGDGTLAWQTTLENAGATEQVTIIATDTQGFESQQTFRLTVDSAVNP